jgi:trehalose 6-phosphate synthase/phosphatase
VKIIHAANRLPVTITRDAVVKSDGGLASALEGVCREHESIWVGWPGAETSKEEQAAVNEMMLNQSGVVPVFLNRKEREGYYEGFSNSSLWPLLHYLPGYMKYNDDWFSPYERVNRLFAEAAASRADDGDLVWVHDYHLLLLPSMLKQLRPDLKIGFFLHTPFPSYELFRCHPRCRELLRGMLGADLIGFHTFGYLRHFRSALLRIISVESSLNQVVHDGRAKRLGVFPIGIDGRRFEEVMKTKAFKEHLKTLNEQYRKKSVILSVERLDYSKGIPKKLQAIELFLQRYPDKRENTSFIFIAVPSREEVDAYRELKKSVELSVGHINGQFATLKNIPLNFINRSLSFAELAALYVRADAALVTPLVDGMNLVAKEYAACQVDGDGVLILSEFAGAAQELFNAILVNPYDIDAVARAAAEALDMSKEERRVRMLPMRRRVLQYDVVHWADDFIRMLSDPLTEIRSALDFNAFSKEIIQAVSDGDERKFFFLDYDGTLREFEDNPEDAAPTAELRDIFSKLHSRLDFDVNLISGRDTDFLDKYFCDYRFTLAAEQGYLVRRPGRPWAAFNPDADLSWIKDVEKIFSLYALSTPGSAVEVKRSSIVWHYRKADPEFGMWKANHLIGELTEAVSNLPVEIQHGNRVVEVRSQQVSKGIIVERLLKERGGSGVVLCIGDDQTDESMLQLIRPSLFSVKVGEGATSAKYRIASPAQVRALLQEILSYKKEGRRTGE